MKIKLNEIKIGKRYRIDLGDLTSLKESISKIGLLHPVVINENNELIAGRRRMEACKQLGWDEVPVNQIHIDNLRKGEYDENVARKQFTPSESVAIAIELNETESKQGQLLSESDRSHPRDKVAKIVGLSTDTLSKAKQVVESNNEELIHLMDNEGNVNQAYKELKKKKREEELNKQKEQIEKLAPEHIIQNKFDVIVIDPPWNYGREYDPDTSRVANPYPEMNQEELKAINLPANKDCVMWLWTTNNFMKQAYELAEHWGFEVKNILTWNKVNIGVGYWLRNVTEHCLLCVKGKPVWDNKTETSLITEKRTSHSTKPEAFYQMVEKICAGAKIDYFARKKREGWEVYGNEVV